MRPRLLGVAAIGASVGIAGAGNPQVRVLSDTPSQKDGGGDASSATQSQEVQDNHTGIPAYCEEEDDWVERFTVVRYGVLGLVVLSRVVATFLSNKDGEKTEQTENHPQLTLRLAKAWKE